MRSVAEGKRAGAHRAGFRAVLGFAPNYLSDSSFIVTPHHSSASSRTCQLATATIHPPFPCSHVTTRHPHGISRRKIPLPLRLLRKGPSPLAPRLSSRAVPNEAFPAQCPKLRFLQPLLD